ncbi:MAG TPA: D-amino-acid transaminase [Xanthobacteraceae bacterium]
MPRIAYVNGRYLRSRDALVSIEDRGYQFSDGIYEVCEVRGGAIIDERRHLERLRRSLDELRILLPLSLRALAVIMRETIRRNRVRDGIVYVQMTRGVARRDHAFPPPGTAPSLVVTARSLDVAGNENKARQGIAVITVPDTRWARPDIKSISLLPNVLAKQAARERGAAEAWFVDRDGRVTEGASTNAWIVTADSKVVTRPADNEILRGITRAVLIEALKAQRLLFEERPFTVAEAYGAREAFVTAASQIVMPVVRIDDRAIGGGAPGPVAKSLRETFHAYAERS